MVLAKVLDLISIRCMFISRKIKLLMQEEEFGQLTDGFTVYTLVKKNATLA
ncbi:Protein of unknown function [Bacillus cytotoxicus]|nr:Protein of unknown function [Bacillus cytotoxicus]